MPHQLLLQTRLLFDGGYYSQALQLLEEQTVEEFSTKEYQLEYIYRKARLYHSLKQSSNAISFYKKTYDNGKSTPLYYACSATLQLGLLYEEDKNWEKAKMAYQMCLKEQPKQYQNSLHHKAKKRLKFIEKLSNIK